MHQFQYLRRKEAADYLRANYGHGSPRTLAKLATIGGGPEMVYSGRMPLYSPEALDAWARAKLSGPVRSTSERRSGRV